MTCCRGTPALASVPTSSVSSTRTLALRGALAVACTQAPTRPPPAEAPTPGDPGVAPPGHGASTPGSAWTSGAVMLCPATVTVTLAIAPPVPRACTQAVPIGEALTPRLSSDPVVPPVTPVIPERRTTDPADAGLHAGLDSREDRAHRSRHAGHRGRPLGRRAPPGPGPCCTGTGTGRHGDRRHRPGRDGQLGHRRRREGAAPARWARTPTGRAAWAQTPRARGAGPTAARGPTPTARTRSRPARTAPSTRTHRRPSSLSPGLLRRRSPGSAQGRTRLGGRQDVDQT